MDGSVNRCWRRRPAGVAGQGGSGFVWSRCSAVDVLLRVKPRGGREGLCGALPSFRSLQARAKCRKTLWRLGWVPRSKRALSASRCVHGCGPAEYRCACAPRPAASDAPEFTGRSFPPQQVFVRCYISICYLFFYFVAVVHVLIMFDLFSRPRSARSAEYVTLH